MNESQATKIIRNVDAYKGPESKGFVRYMHLPKRVVQGMHLAHIVVDKAPANEFIARAVDFLGGMTNEEYRVWLLAN